MSNLRKIIIAVAGPALGAGLASLPADGSITVRWWLIVTAAAVGGLASIGTNAGIKARQRRR